jgi:riboflavin biosynthesis pyrimidine reductase
VSLELLWEREDLPRDGLPEELGVLYDGALGFDEPCVYANFVETLDGVVAIPAVEGSNAIVAYESVDDKFVMALLRAFADVVLVGAGTLRASQRGRWRPAGPHPQGEQAFAELRAARGRPEHPAVAVVTTGATLDIEHGVLPNALVLTTAAGAAKLDGLVPNVVTVNDGDAVDLKAAVALLHERGFSLVLAEAGPRTFAQLVRDELVDELFLTVSPLLAGRVATGHRLGLVEGVELLPERRVPLRLLSLRRAREQEHLFLRYSFR